MDEQQRIKEKIGSELAQAVLDLKLRGMQFSRSEFAQRKRATIERLAGEYMLLHMPAVTATD